MSFNLPKVEQVKLWRREDVREFLQGKKDSLDLDIKEIGKIYDNKIDGNTLLGLTQNDLISIGVALKPAKGIVKLVDQIQESK